MNAILKKIALKSLQVIEVIKKGFLFSVYWERYNKRISLTK